MGEKETSKSLCCTQPDSQTFEIGLTNLGIITDVFKQAFKFYIATWFEQPSVD